MNNSVIEARRIWEELKSEGLDPREISGRIAFARRIRDEVCGEADEKYIDSTVKAMIVLDGVVNKQRIPVEDECIGNKADKLLRDMKRIWIDIGRKSKVTWMDEIEFRNRANKLRSEEIPRNVLDKAVEQFRRDDDYVLFGGPRDHFTIADFYGMTIEECFPDKAAEIRKDLAEEERLKKLMDERKREKRRIRREQGP